MNNIINTIEEVKEELAEKCLAYCEGGFITPNDIIFDDSRSWSLYIHGYRLGLDVNKFGAYRNYLGGGIRSGIKSNGRECDGTVELARQFENGLRQIENIYNSDCPEDAEQWELNTGVLLD